MGVELEGAVGREPQHAGQRAAAALERPRVKLDPFVQAKIEAGVEAVAASQQAGRIDRAAHAAGAFGVETGADLEQAPLNAEGRQGLQPQLRPVDDNRHRQPR